MKSRRMMEMWRYGLMLTLLCVMSFPQFAAAAAPVSQIPTGPRDINGNWATPDYYTTANWANTPPLAKFVDTLPGLTSGNANNLGQYLPLAVADTTTYPGSDYYIIELREYSERMHSGLNPTRLRGYVQVNAAGVPVAPIHYLGPVILADRDRPVRLKFTNKLPTGTGGDLFIPVDTSVMGSGIGPADAAGAPCDNTPLNNPNGCAPYTQNRADVHLHGGRTPWISDGTPHQWVVPATEVTPFKQGVSLVNVPDMPDPGDGSATYYFTNQQSARLMFYHDHAFGITRLNVYAGEAAGYVIKDPFEVDLMTRGIIPPLLDQIPLIIQDKTFVDATPVTHPVTGDPTHQVRVTDPLWNWGTGAADVNGIKTPITGDLWVPHVYMPAQTSTAGAGGVNPFGRWMYGPWFYPATVVDVGPKANPYYDPDCSSTNPFILANCQTPGQPVQIPGTPNVSMGMEAFQDTAVVNGTAFPTLTVDPRAYRFRILNAANDRFQNLSFYKADSTAGNISPEAALAVGTADARGYLRSNKTEVKMVPASAATAAANNWPPLWPVDGRDGGVPDPGVCTGTGESLACPNLGPSFLQIGTEGGFLPNPVVINPQPITYNTDPTAFWVGNVDKMGLALGPAERADVIVDFTQFAGQTLLLYNDAPAAWPARVAGYDYYTGAPDMRDSGGFGTGGTFDQITGAWVGGTGPLPGYAPNTRTVMQVIVRATAAGAPYVFDPAALQAEFTPASPATPGLFQKAQEPIIVGQAAYATVYPNSYFPTNFPWEGISQINDHNFQFYTLAGEQVVVPQEPKGIHDEMGASFDPVYGRMSGNLAMQLPNPTTLNALLILYGFADVPTETIKNSISADVQVNVGTTTLADGTQIWKISHNGVDTHPIHFHVFDVQLLNRVGWDGQILMPEPNELGWKDTVKISPLEDTIVAVRPRAPAMPFGIPNSLRPLNPAIPLGSVMGFTSIDPTTGQAYVAPSPYAGGVTNILFDFGWEYVWHCHILSHEEMDMMRPVVLQYVAELPPAFTATVNASGVNWVDPTPIVSPLSTNPEVYRNAANEIGFNVYRTTAGAFPLDGAGKPVPLNGTQFIRANSTTFADAGANANGQTYVVEAFNAKGSTLAFVGSTPFTVTATVTNGPTFTSPGPVNLAAATTALPTGVTISQVNFYSGATLIGSDTTSPYALVWNSATVGTHSITAKALINIPGGAVVSAPVIVTVGGGLVASFTPADAASTNVCSPFTFTSTSTGPISGYSWLINGVNYTTNLVTPTLHAGVYPVTLGIINSVTGETAQVTNTVTVTNNAPVADAGGTGGTGGSGGSYTVVPGGSLTLAGTATDADACDVLTYAWDLDNKNGYEFVSTTLPFAAITYNSLWTVLGSGTFTINFKVTDTNGGISTKTALLTLGASVPPTVSLTAPANGATTSFGTNITLTASVAADVGATISKVEFFDGATLLNTDFASPYSFVWSGAALGAHSLTAKATDSRGLVTTSAGVGIVVSANPLSGTLTPNLASPQVKGVSVVFSAAALGGNGATYEYEFWRKSPAGAWGIVQAYSAASTYTWNTATAVLGNYQLGVHIRNQGQSAYIDVAPYVNYTVTTNIPASGTLTPNLASPQIKGASIVMTATATGGTGTPYQYEFWRKNPAGAWSIVQAYSTTSTYTWNTATTAAGAYQLGVHIRNQGQAKYIDVAPYVDYTITSNVPTSGTLTPNLTSPQIKGASIVMTATAAGGTGTPYQYEFWRKSPAGAWSIVQAYSTTSTYTWNTATTAAGAYQLGVHIRNQGQTAFIDVVPYVDYTITSNVPTSGTLTPNLTSPQIKGASIVMTATATGGTGTPYEYEFWRKNPAGAWSIVQAYSTTSTYTWNTATTAAGAYQLGVHIRNQGQTAFIDVLPYVNFTVTP